MEFEKIKKLTVEEILIWISLNTDNIDAMNKISNLTFPFTSKYINYISKKE